jgi:predicted RNA-binding Zn ribbon-like protein
MDGTGQRATPPSFELIGGHVCLDFVNTVGGIRGGLAHELLTSYTDLVAWSLQAHLLSQEEALLLLATGQGAAEEAAAVLERAYILREALYRVFTALVKGTAPASDDLAALNWELEQGMAGAHLIATAEGFGWSWNVHERALDWVLGPVARGAAILLTSDDRKHLRQCASPTCGWLFLDSTKNHRRQWCSTTGCGNKARVQRHRQRRSMPRWKVLEKA